MRGLIELAPGLHHISIDPESALEEYVKDQLPRGLSDVLASSRLFSYLVAATPGSGQLLAKGQQAVHLLFHADGAAIGTGALGSDVDDIGILRQL